MTADAPSAPQPPRRVPRTDVRAHRRAKRDPGSSRLLTLGATLLIPVVAVVLWFVSTSNGWISELLLASPGQVWEQFTSRLADGTLVRDVAVSFRRVLAGLGLSILIGVVLGLISGLSRWGHRILDGTLHAIKAVPFPALIPLLLIWLGIGEALRIGILVLAATFAIYLNTVGGIVGIDPKLRELAATRGVRGWRLIVTIVLPGALPQFLVGLRLALVISFLALVFAEEIAPEEGLGYILWRAAQLSQTDAIILVAVLYAIIGLVISALVTLLERVLLPWRRGFTS
ncbi:ABC transporter permease [Microbacterium sp. 18062]|uniref:ABC transporter permease n=1 Tax=Microbacterium sp. 18062 TaxID=2681410 RepID=UPI00190F48CB|nr:ABC transporter permease [Microbacterium sp. 18062]